MQSDSSAVSVVFDCSPIKIKLPQLFYVGTDYGDFCKQTAAFFHNLTLHCTEKTSALTNQLVLLSCPAKRSYNRFFSRSVLIFSLTR